MMAASRVRCPTCRAPVERDPQSRPKSYPFCSDRCRLVDLHRWLTGAYAIPVGAPTPEDFQEAARGLPEGGGE